MNMPTTEPIPTFIRPLIEYAFLNKPSELGILICSDCREIGPDEPTTYEYICETPDETDSPIGTCEWCHSEIKFSEVIV